ncbi:cyclase family protein [Candidatus Roizmanbacteria bacterium]|nr:cyclase family protein [Candidatus Roizmanbacteria bacterium]
MKIIDLSQILYDHMPVYPGDPDVIIKKVFSFEKNGWNMNRIEINSHDGTHVNIPIHGTKNGRNLDTYSIDDFIGESHLYSNEKDIQKDCGLIFYSVPLDWKIARKIAVIKPKFIGLSDKFEFDIEIEKFLLDKEIISYERLENCQKLPKKFIFYGVPLKIKEADGSPVRAFATYE